MTAHQIHPMPSTAMNGRWGSSVEIPRMPTILFLVFTLGGCKDLTSNPGLPAGTPDPASYNNKAGALGMRNAAIFQVETTLPSYIVDAGLLTDELEDRRTTTTLGVLEAQSLVSDPLDERILSEGTAGGSTDYLNLQNVRALTNQAIGALTTYDTAAPDTVTSKVMRGELYALEGYAEIMLADLFCSGVPLSTFDFQKDFTYHASSTAAQVYQDAVAKFETALALADTSSQVLNLARVGKGRAFLDLGQYDSAAAAVTAVPNGFQYQLATVWQGCSGCEPNALNSVATVSDREGNNGLPYRSGGDLRTAVDTVATMDTNSTTGQISPLPVPLVLPVKYAATLTISGVGTGYVPISVANGIEAQLIRAEAELQPVSAPSGPWITTLNQLRESIGLRDTTDPVTVSGRIALLFHERAYWLFVTGHRQGDLRRLIRQYGQYGFTPDQVYPAGLYLAPGTGQYGADINAPIPTTEDANPLFHGCLSRGA